MHQFCERVFVLKNLHERFYSRPKLQHKWWYQSRVMLFQLKILALYPGFTKKIPEFTKSTPPKLLDMMITMTRGWMRVACTHGGGLPFPATGGKV